MKNEKKKKDDVFDKIEAWIRTKISNEVLATLIMLIVGLLMVALLIGFFVLPFISYSTLFLKILCTVLWGISCPVIIGIIILDNQFKDRKERNETILGIVVITIFFFLMLINKNYYSLGTFLDVCTFAAIIILPVMGIYWFIKAWKQNPQDAVTAVILGLLFVIGFLSILSSSLDAFDIGTNKILLVVGAICIALPIITIFISKTVGESSKSKAALYASIFVLVTLGLIGVSYILHKLNSGINGYQIFATLFASVLGGGVTLLGVAWTIKQTEKTRNEEQIQFAKPVFAIRSANNDDANFIRTKCYASKNGEYNNGCFFYIENANINSFRLIKVKHDNDWYIFEGYTQFIPNDKMLIGFRFNLETGIKLVVVDQIGIEHFYELKMEPILNEYLRNNKRDISKAFTIIEIKESSQCEI